MKIYVYKSRLLKGIIAVFDAVGYFLKWTLSLFKKRNARQIERILILKLDHAGDVLLATPAIKSIRNGFPQAHITLVVGPWSKGIVEGEKYINEVICYRAYWRDRNPGRHFNIRDSLKFIRVLRRGKYDLFFDLRGDLFAIIIAALSGIPRRVGFGWEGGGFLLTDEVNTTINKHQVEILLDAARAIGIRPAAAEIVITISEDDKKYAYAMLKENNWHESLLTIGLHIGSGCPSKMWAVERYAGLMERIVEHFKAQIVLVGGADDRAVTEQAAGLLHFKPVNMVGNLTFKQTAAVMEKCALFIGNDSAPIHIAAAVGVPAIVLFSAANDWQRWRPYGNDVDVICKDVKCKGCEKAACDNMECMNLITVDEVFDLVLKKIKIVEAEERLDGIQ